MDKGFETKAGHVIGPVRLRRKVGRGSIGEVWSAEHRKHGTTVAIKLLNAQRSKDPWAIRALENELEIAASIRHEGILQILDHGRHQPSPETPSLPFLIMEWASGGSLREAKGALTWPTLRSILLQLLDALAHSHAKGFIHRDIKPSNILLERPTNTTLPRVLLSDFGISQAVRAAEGIEGSVAGTPAYMAPEQLHGHLFSQGPWTDLYALGCTAWALACGEPPFGSTGLTADLTHAHLVLEPPPFRPNHPMPSGLEGWLRRVLSKRIAERFVRAADARYALCSVFPSSLRQPSKAHDIRTRPHVRENHNDTTKHKTEPIPPHPMHQEHEDPWQSLPAPRSPRLPILRPPPQKRPPTSKASLWSPPPEMSPDSIRRRPIPLVGRDREKEQLWMMLNRVTTEGRMRIVRIRGSSGTGSSHLARWLCENAHRTGMATPLTGGSELEAGGPASLLHALARHLRLDGMDPHLGELVLCEQLKSLGRFGNSEAKRIHGLLTDPFSSERTLEHADIHSLMRLCLSISRYPGPERPLVLQIDESRWNGTTMSILRQWKESQGLSPLPLLVLLVRRTPINPNIPRGREFRPAPTADLSINLAGISTRAQNELYQDVLGLDPALSGELIEHSQGFPAYAVKMIHRWIEDGELFSTNKGLMRRDPLAPIRVMNPNSRWNEHITECLDGLDSTNRRCIEVGAALGLSFARETWFQSCFFAELHPSTGLVETLIRRGLWVEEPKGNRLAFAHPMLRACVMLGAQTHGRLAGHHLACARAIESQIVPASEASGELARHLLASLQPTDALPHLRHAAEEALSRGQIAKASQLLRAHAAILEIGTGRLVRERIASDLLRARTSWANGQREAATRLLKWCVDQIGKAPQHNLENELMLTFDALEGKRSSTPTSWLPPSAMSEMRNG